MQQVFIYAVPAFTLAMVLEWVLLRRAARKAASTPAPATQASAHPSDPASGPGGGAPPHLGYASKDTAASLGMGVGSIFVGIAGDLFLVFAVGVLNGLTPLKVPDDAWWALPAVILAVDFALYWSHRCHHEVRFMWAAHVNHHSSTHYNLSTALRQSWTEHLTGLPFYIALGLLGFSAPLILAGFAINLLYQFWVHTELVRTIGPLEWILNTPSHHRVHHGSNPEYLDRNYGGILIIWDRLFGTFEPERAPVDYGLVKNITTYNLVQIAFHEWRAMFAEARAARSWSERWRRVLGRPGYHPEGLTLTAPQLRAQAQAAGPAPARAGGTPARPELEGAS